MSRRCFLTGKGVQTGNNVSHAQNKTRRRFLPNLQVASIYSEALKETMRMRISTKALRSIEHQGGIDAFLLAAKDADLDVVGRRLKRRVRKAMEKRAAA